MEQSVYLRVCQVSAVCFLVRNRLVPTESLNDVCGQHTLYIH